MTAVGGHDLAVGIDLVCVDDVAESFQRLGEHYLERLFTNEEVASCTVGGTISPRALAVRFAAKEATIKALQPKAEIPDWRTIEVLSLGKGHYDLALHGKASQLADEAGLQSFSLSLTCAAGLCMAFVVGSALALPRSPKIGASQP
ncbi:MAG: holo-ACP synthase [Acidimicrobiales bacterium]